jgi:hypothetical protein
VWRASAFLTLFSAEVGLACFAVAFGAEAALAGARDARVGRGTLQRRPDRVLLWRVPGNKAGVGNSRQLAVPLAHRQVVRQQRLPGPLSRWPSHITVFLFLHWVIVFY